MTTDPTTPAADAPQGQAVAVQRARPMVESVQPLFDTDRFEHFQRAATALMHSSLLPESIRANSPQACFSNLMLVFDLSDRWKVPALSIAQCIAVVHNKVVYEGKLITAMLQASLGVQLQFHYTGDRGTPGYRVFVWDKPFDTLTDEQLAALAPGRYPKGARMIDGAVSDWQTFQKNSTTPNPAWTGAAQHNQLAYRGSREWTRLYEPGHLLGVYGEDEIEDYEDRRDARAPAADGPAINAGFTRAAPAAEATVVSVTVVVDETAPADPAKPARSRGKAGEAEAQRKADEEAATAERLAKNEAAEELGRKDGASGQMPNPLKAWGEEERQCYANGHIVGTQEREAGKVQGKSVVQDATETVQLAADVEALAEDVSTEGREGLALDAFEAGHEAGLKGEDLKVPRAWSEFPDDFTAGWHGGAAERLADATEGDDGEDGDEEEFAGDGGTGNDMLDAIAEAEPELVQQVVEDHGDDEPVTAFDAFNAGVTGLQSWADVKQSLNGLSRTDDWKAAMAAAGDTRIRQARIAAWCRVVQLQAEGKEAVDMVADLTAFRCWVETTDDTDAIQGNWNVLVRQPLYEALADTQKAALARAIKARMAELLQPGLKV